MPAFLFDHWTRSVSTTFTRRGLALALGLAALWRLVLAGAKKNRKKRKKITRNSFGCVNVGGFCKNAGHCCSGICEGKKDKKRCKSHDTGGCQANQDVCVGDEEEECVTSAGNGGVCHRTTGNASYCAALVDGGDCFSCTTDADCRPFCGPDAACIVCTSECEEGTACVGVETCEVPS